MIDIVEIIHNAYVEQERKIDKKYEKLLDNVVEAEHKIIDVIGDDKKELIRELERADDLISIYNEKILIKFVLDFLQNMFCNSKKWPGNLYC